MPHPYWPLFDLRITTSDLLLRPMAEADLLTLAQIQPLDVELDPAATRFAGVPECVDRGIVTFQDYWKAYGTWKPASWKLLFTVSREDVLIGSQRLEGDDFTILKEVDSASFLIPEARGKGYGKQMRIAVLALAFDSLGAESAKTSAWHDNHASLGVSAALGYVPNGETRHARGEGVDRMVHLAMSREIWIERGHSAGVTIEGFAACRPLFGLA